MLRHVQTVYWTIVLLFQFLHSGQTHASQDWMNGTLAGKTFFVVWTHVKTCVSWKKLKPRQWLVYLHCFPLICPFFSMNFEAWTCSNVPWHPALGGISAKRKISDFASWTPGQVMVKWGLNDTTKTNVGYCGIVFMFHVDNMWYEVHVSSSRMRRNC